MEASRHGLEFAEVAADTELRDHLKAGEYFYAELPGETQYSVTRLVCFVKREGEAEGVAAKSVPLQFGRDVAARLLMMPGRAHWKACLLNKDSETDARDDLAAAFAEYTPG